MKKFSILTLVALALVLGPAAFADTPEILSAADPDIAAEACPTVLEAETVATVAAPLTLETLLRQEPIATVNSCETECGAEWRDCWEACPPFAQICWDGCAMERQACLALC